MFGDLKPYHEMKESGLPWLSDVPAHWEVWKLRQLLKPVVERNRPDLPLLSVVRERGVILRDLTSQDENRNYIPEDLSNYKVVRSSQFAMNKMKAWQGSYGVSGYDGIVSPAYFVFDLNKVGGEFFHWAIRSRAYVPQFHRASDGVRIGQWDLSQERMKEIPFLVPPHDEQAAIVHFLNHADRRIGRAIRAKQKMAALLNEQKQAIIHQAVTRGLNPDVRLKSSGVEWLGDVPEHWEVMALRRRWSVTDCKHLTVPFVEDGIPLASVREVQTFDLALSNAKRTTRESYDLLVEGNRTPRKGDLIYCRNVSVGAAAYVDTEEPFAMGQDVCLIRSACENQRFLNYFMQSPAMERQLSLLLVGSTFNRINVSEIKALTVVVPLRAEQDAISSYLDQELRGADQAIDEAQSGIALLKEYRTRLVADVVTGKLDVRAAAAHLPEVVEEIEPAEAIDAPDDVDEEALDTPPDTAEEAVA